MHRYNKIYNFTADEWIKLKRLSAIDESCGNINKYLDKIVKDHVNSNYKTEYDSVFSKGKSDE